MDNNIVSVVVPTAAFSPVLHLYRDTCLMANEYINSEFNDNDNNKLITYKMTSLVVKVPTYYMPLSVLTVDIIEMFTNI